MTDQFSQPGHAPQSISYKDSLTEWVEGDGGDGHPGPPSVHTGEENWRQVDTFSEYPPTPRGQYIQQTQPKLAPVPVQAYTTPRWRLPSMWSVGMIVATVVLLVTSVIAIIFAFIQIRNSIDSTFEGTEAAESVPYPLLALLALIPALIIGLCVWVIDRWEREPIPLYLIALGWGAGISIVMALYGNQWWDAMAQNVANTREEYQVLTIAVGAGVVEEGAKALGLLLIFFLFFKYVNGPIDGIVLGLLIGVGFAFTENILYFAQASGLENLAEQGYNVPEGQSVGSYFLNRAILTPFVHPLATALTGLFMGIASTRRNPRILVFPLGLLGYLLGATLHGLHNFSSIREFATEPLSRTLLQAPVYAGAIALVLMTTQMQRRTTHRGLVEYAAAGWISWNEIAMVMNMTNRRRAKVWAEASVVERGGRAEDGRRAMRRFQHELIHLGYTRTVNIDRRTAHTLDARHKEAERLDLITRLRNVFAEIEDANASLQRFGVPAGGELVASGAMAGYAYAQAQPGGDAGVAASGGSPGGDAGVAASEGSPGFDGGVADEGAAVFQEEQLEAAGESGVGQTPAQPAESGVEHGADADFGQPSGEDEFDFGQPSGEASQTREGESTEPEDRDGLEGEQVGAWAVPDGYAGAGQSQLDAGSQARVGEWAGAGAELGQRDREWEARPAPSDEEDTGQSGLDAAGQMGGEVAADQADEEAAGQMAVEAAAGESDQEDATRVLEGVGQAPVPDDGSAPTEVFATSLTQLPPPGSVPTRARGAFADPAGATDSQPTEVFDRRAHVVHADPEPADAADTGQAAETFGDDPSAAAHEGSTQVYEAQQWPGHYGAPSQEPYVAPRDHGWVAGPEFPDMSQMPAPRVSMWERMPDDAASAWPSPMPERPELPLEPDQWPGHEGHEQSTPPSNEPAGQPIAEPTGSDQDNAARWQTLVRKHPIFGQDGRVTTAAGEQAEQPRQPELRGQPMQGEWPEQRQEERVESPGPADVPVDSNGDIVPDSTWQAGATAEGEKIAAAEEDSQGGGRGEGSAS
ncbi:MAG: PrsW family glutamic-type intramembrane protease [Actinomycetaceae bacterium]|nr:PrsW family glutamic-type intramembrane protease [Actinomycetaceae bacterium]